MKHKYLKTKRIKHNKNKTNGGTTRKLTSSIGGGGETDCKLKYIQLQKEYTRLQKFIFKEIREKDKKIINLLKRLQNSNNNLVLLENENEKLENIIKKLKQNTDFDSLD